MDSESNLLNACSFFIGQFFLMYMLVSTIVVVSVRVGIRDGCNLFSMIFSLNVRSRCLMFCVFGGICNCRTEKMHRW